MADIVRYSGVSRVSHFRRVGGEAPVASAVAWLSTISGRMQRSGMRKPFAGEPGFRWRCIRATRYSRYTCSGADRHSVHCIPPGFALRTAAYPTG